MWRKFFLLSDFSVPCISQNMKVAGVRQTPNVLQISQFQPALHNFPTIKSTLAGGHEICSREVKIGPILFFTCVICMGSKNADQFQIL